MRVIELIEILKRMPKNYRVSIYYETLDLGCLEFDVKEIKNEKLVELRFD